MKSGSEVGTNHRFLFFFQRRTLSEQSSYELSGKDSHQNRQISPYFDFVISPFSPPLSETLISFEVAEKATVVKDCPSKLPGTLLQCLLSGDCRVV